MFIFTCTLNMIGCTMYNVHDYIICVMCVFRFDLCKIQTNLKEFLPLTLLNIAGGQIYPSLSFFFK